MMTPEYKLIVFDKIASGRITKENLCQFVDAPQFVKYKTQFNRAFEYRQSVVALEKQENSMRS